MSGDSVRASGTLHTKKRLSEISNPNRQKPMPTNNPKSPGALIKTPTSATNKSLGHEKRERIKRPPKTPQTVEVYYRIYKPPTTLKEGEPAELDENEERKVPKLEEAEGDNPE